VRYILQISIPPVESGIEEGGGNAPDERVFVPLYFMETIKHTTMMSVKFGKVVEYVLQKGGQSIP